MVMMMMQHFEELKTCYAVTVNWSTMQLVHSIDLAFYWDFCLNLLRGTLKKHMNCGCVCVCMSQSSSSVSWIVFCCNTYNRSKYNCKHTEYLAAYLLCMLVQPALVIQGVFFQNLSTLIALCRFNFGRQCKC